MNLHDSAEKEAADQQNMSELVENIDSMITDLTYKSPVDQEHINIMSGINFDDSLDKKPIPLGAHMIPPQFALESMLSHNENAMNASELKIIDSTMSSAPMPQTTATIPKAPAQKTQSKMPADHSSQTNPTIPLKLITILHNTKKESPTKIEVPQRKNNKIIEPTDETLVEDAIINTTEMFSPESEESLSSLHEAFLSSLNRQSDISSDELLHHNSPIFLQRPINNLPPSFIGGTNFPGLPTTNAIESKHNFQTNPIRSELDFIIPELNKNKHTHGFGHTNNFDSENYQVIPADDTNLSNTESYVVNPVDVDKLKQGKFEFFY